MMSLRTARTSFGAIAIALGMVFAGTATAAAQNATCARLEAQLARASQNTGGNSAQLRKWTRAVQLQKDAMATTRRQAQAAGCSGANRAAAVCRGYTTKLGRMQANLKKLNAGVRRYSRGKGNARQVRALKARLRRLRCGQEPRQRQARHEARSEPRRPSGLFGMLFRNSPRDRSIAEYRTVPRDTRNARVMRQPREIDDLRDARERHRSILQASARNDAWGTAGDNPFEDDITVSGGAFRTLCVRTCDGYYFPISFSTSKRNFYRDQLICEQMCPDAKVKLFVHRNPGEESEDMTTVSGEPYADMDYAFAYRKAFKPSCSCGRVTPTMTPIDTKNLPTPRTIAGQIEVSVRDDAIKSGDEWVELPVPAKKLPAGADPDTIENLRGNFSPLAVASPDSKLAASASNGDRKVRIVGPTFFADQ